MRKTNDEKEDICRKYRDYLEIINVFGNKVMLQKQLWQYIDKFGIEKHYIDFMKAISQLEQYEIIKKENFFSTSNKVIVFKKYAIRFLANVRYSKDVGAVPKTTSGERELLSMFKNHYILNEVIPKLEEMDIEPSLMNIQCYLDNNCSTVLYSKNKGIDFFPVLYNKFRMALSEEIDQIYMELCQREEEREKARAKGSIARDGKGSKGKIELSKGNAIEKAKIALQNKKDKEESKAEDVKTPKEKKLARYDLDSMLNGFVYIEKMELTKMNDENLLTINVVQFDLFNKQNLYHLALCISAVYLMFLRYIDKGYGIKINYNVVTYDKIAEQNLEKEAKRTGGINPITKEPNDIERLKQYFKLNGISFMEWNLIDVKFINYNVSDGYLDGIKYRNIEKSNGRPKGSKNKPKA